MRVEQRVCDLCGRRSGLCVTHHAGQAGRVLPAAMSMEDRGWTAITIGDVDDVDRCPDCTFMDHREPHPLGETRP